MDGYKAGDRFDWLGQMWQVIRSRARSREMDCARPIADSFGKVALVGGKTFHERDMVHARRLTGGGQ